MANRYTIGVADAFSTDGNTRVPVDDAHPLPVTIAGNAVNNAVNLVQVGGSAISNGGAAGGQGVGGLVASGAAVSGTNPLVIAWQDQSGNVIVPQANLDGPALVSAARTATTDSPDITIGNHRGIIIYLNITAASGTGGLQVVYRGKDSISGNYVNFANLPTAITATGTTAYVFYPGASSAAGNIKAATADPISHVGNIHVVAVDSSSYTYSVSYALIQ